MLCIGVSCTSRYSAILQELIVLGHAGFTVGQKSCAWFTWADFDEDGRPPWIEEYKGNSNVATAAAAMASTNACPIDDA